MIYVPFIFAWMAITSVIGVILIAIGRAFPWVLLATFLFLCTQVSMAGAPTWQLVFVKDAQLVPHGEPHDDRRSCIRLGTMYMQTALNEHDKPQLEGFFCDRDPPLPVPEKVTAICTAPTRQCS